jgi:hypothetical protein
VAALGDALASADGVASWDSGWSTIDISFLNKLGGFV